MKSWTKDIVPSVLAIGAILSGPVLTMTMFREKLGASYAFGAIDALLVVFAIQVLYIRYSNISMHQDEDGSSRLENGDGKGKSD